MLPIEFQPDNALWLLIGAVLGAIAGWSFRSMTYARRVEQKVNRLEQRLHDDDNGFVDIQSLGVGAMVILVAIAAILTGFAAYQTDNTNDRLDRVVTCLLNANEQQVTALNQRTSFSDESAQAEEDLLAAYQSVFDAVTSPEQEPVQQLQALRQAQRATAARLRLIEKNADLRAQYPYPEARDVRECAKGG